MSTTDRLYSIKTSKESLSNLIDRLLIAKNQLIENGNYRITISNPLKKMSDFISVMEKYDISSQNSLLSFEVFDSKELEDIISDIKGYNRLSFFTHIDENPKKSYLSHWFEINPKLEDFHISVSLPYTEEIELSKSTLINFLEYFTELKLIRFPYSNIQEVVENLIGLNTNNRNEKWTYEGAVKLQAWPNYSQVGKNEMRPSSVKMSFNKRHYEKYGNYINMANIFNNHISEYFSDDRYYVKGSLYFDFNQTIIRKIEAVNFKSFKLPIFIDLKNCTKDEIRNLWNLEGDSQKSIQIEDFIWRYTGTKYTFNRISIFQNLNEEEISFEIEIDKNIDESYINKIEEELDLKFEFKGYQ